jgi:uncharacterized glyoxalase superfamily protein PhnB
MAAKVKAIPDGYQTITPSIVVKDGAKAMDFYKKAFGAEEIMRMLGPSGKIMHAELKIGTSRVMLADEMPEMGCMAPTSPGATPVGFYVYVENADAAFKRAVDAGATVKMPPADMFWGDRLGAIIDPFGHQWSISQHIADPTPEEMKKGQAEFAAKFAKKK